MTWQQCKQCFAKFKSDHFFQVDKKLIKQVDKQVDKRVDAVDKQLIS